MNHLRRPAAAAILALTCAFSVGDASAQVTKATPFTGSGKTPSPPTPASGTPPPVPAGCGTPTLADCARGDFYASPCATAPASKQGILNYCTWVFQREWSNAAGAAQTALFPTSAPSTLSPIITKARSIDRGKTFPATTTVRPAGKRRFAGTTPPARGSASTPGGAVGNLSWTPTRGRSSNGSYASMSTVSYLGQQATIDREVQLFRQPTAQASDPGLVGKANILHGLLTAPPPFAPTPGPAVSSCEEYAYKRWGDYSKFSRAAKLLGRNWRQLYNIANDPGSPEFFNKQLLQSSTSAPTPLQIREKITGNHWRDPNTPPGGTPVMHHEAWLPVNAYFAVKPTWISKPAMGVSATQQQQINQAIQARWNVVQNRPSAIYVKSDASPLGIHREAKARFDAVYGNPHDDELADIAKRKKVYHNRLAEWMTALTGLNCASASDPCFKCSAPPAPPLGKGAQLPSTIQKLRETIGGWPVVNPADMSSLWQTGNVMQDQRSLIVLELMAPEMANFEKGALQGGGTQRSLSSPGTGPGLTVSDPCRAALEAQRVQYTAIVDGAERSMSRLLLNELTYGDRGCLANPGPNNANICDWSYEIFASEVSHLFDEEVEQDFQGCRADVTAASQASGQTGFANLVKVARNQPLVFPCVWRGDFSGSAPDMRRFLELNGSYHAKSCEVWRQKDDVKAQQQSIADDMSGMKWKPKDGEIYDESVDSLELGEQSAIGAYFNYTTSWKVKRTGRKDQGDPMSSCKYDAAAASTIAAGIDFFGERLELMRLEGSGTGKPTGTSASAIFSHYDFQSFQKKTPMNAPPPNAVGDTFAPPPVPIVSLGGGEVDFWFAIGPIPIHVVFGAIASAGVSYEFTGKAGDNCANLNGPTGFKAISQIEPWVRADAYADASIDVVVASAGVRLDLTLLRLGIPLGANVTNTSGTSWRFFNGGRVSIDMLSGRLTGYVEVGAAPLEESFEATIFAWDGFHTDVATWGLDRTLSNAVMRVANAYDVTIENVKCACDNAANFCCSSVPCLSGPCVSGQKKVNNQNYTCSFTQADVNAFNAGQNDPMKQACSNYVK